MSGPQRRTSCTLPLAGLFAVALAASAARAQFDASTWRVTGRALEVHAVGTPREPWLAALSVTGYAPTEQRLLTLRSAAGRETRSVPPADAVAFDLAELDAAPGPEVVWLSSSRLRVSTSSGALLREIPLSPPLPLPPRTRELSRLRMLDDWEGLAVRTALLPSFAGLRLVPLAGDGPARELPLPITASYETFPPDHPFAQGFASALLVWPRVARADDDGDGRPDLFVSTRYTLGVFRAGASGLAPHATLRSFPAFSDEEEVRPETSMLRAIPSDLDGDGRADLIVHRTVGRLMGSRAHTAIHANREGRGADPSAIPDAELHREGGFSTLEAVDLDGDGRSELLETSLSFGVAQMVRILTLRSAEVQLRVIRFGAGLSGPEVGWSGDVSLPWDLDASRVRAMLPNIDGDWNQDGLRDLAFGDGEGSVRLRLGERTAAGPGFGAEAARVPSTNTSSTLVADADGDGLPDLVSWDMLDAEGRISIALNRGTLPGSPPTLRAPTPQARAQAREARSPRDREGPEGP